jgi:AcrR family transcriptional regulator
MTLEESGQPVRLDRERILDAASAIVGTEGVAALTMRRIGAELGADPTAVYRHFRNKQEMLAELAARMFATQPRLDPGQPWQQRLRVLIAHGLDRYRFHLDLGLLLAESPDDLPGLVQMRERTLELLTEAGLTLPDAALMSQLLENHVVGCGLFFAVSGWSGPGVEADLAARRDAFAGLPATVAPLTREAAPHLFPDPDHAFTATTDLLLRAIEEMARPPAELTEEAACP